jgi:hypothetical protein
MVQKELSDDEMQSILDCSRMPYYLAAAEYAIGVTGDYRREAVLADGCAGCHTEFMISEHWQDAAVPYMRALCPNTQLHVLGGHMAFWEYPERFNEILSAFLTKC